MGETDVKRVCAVSGGRTGKAGEGAQGVSGVQGGSR